MTYIIKNFFSITKENTHTVIIGTVILIIL